MLNGRCINQAVSERKRVATRGGTHRGQHWHGKGNYLVPPAGGRGATHVCAEVSLSAPGGGGSAFRTWEGRNPHAGTVETGGIDSGRSSPTQARGAGKRSRCFRLSPLRLRLRGSRGWLVFYWRCPLRPLVSRRGERFWRAGSCSCFCPFWPSTGCRHYSIGGARPRRPRAAYDPYLMAVTELENERAERARVGLSPSNGG